MHRYVDIKSERNRAEGDEGGKLRILIAYSYASLCYTCVLNGDLISLFMWTVECVSCFRSILHLQWNGHFTNEIIFIHCIYHICLTSRIRTKICLKKVVTDL